MAKLFGSRRLRDIAAQISTAEIIPFVNRVAEWRDDYVHGTLLKDKETSREQQYNQDFFKEILGYTEKPARPHSFEPKATSDTGQLPDAIVGWFDESQGVRNISAVVELKGASTPLDRPQRREGNLSPVQQGFKYKSQYRSVPFVIVSNFEEFRLYNDNQLDFESWKLADLVSPENDYFAFKTWYGLLNRVAFTSPTGQSLTEQRLRSYRFDQEEVGKDFYKEHRQARLALIQEIGQFNPQYQLEPEFVIAKAQKILDRVVFAAFAEDKGLLPEDTLLQLREEVNRSRFGATMWGALRDFFEAIDKGDPRLDIPEGYNGGLFATDSELNQLKLGHSALDRVAALSRFNFTDDLSVSVLGHIFEQSITDLTELKTLGLEAGTSEQSNRKRRKKEGIFYTPDYVVRYMVDHSLGDYLRFHEERLKTEFDLKENILDRTYAGRERQAYLQYFDLLRNIKVVDPACGSGAFLVYVFDYLFSEHQRVQSILNPGNTAASFDEVYRNILRNNIYGVDLNEESVEIAKLSLWLKTALKGKKLTSLDKNIKCGNSLVTSNSLNSSKPFDWHAEFPEVFESGGFDIVIGNPPYVSANDIKKYTPKDEVTYLKKNYVTAKGAVDLYIYFFERGLQILKDGGRLAYISPNRYLSVSYGKALREWLLDNYSIDRLVNCSDTRVFPDASTYPVITFVRKEQQDTYTVISGKLSEQFIDDQSFHSDKLKSLNDYILGFLLNDKLPITEKVRSQSFSLTESAAINATSTAGEADAFSTLISGEASGMKIINTGTIDPFLSLWGLSSFTDKGRDFSKPYLNTDSPLVASRRSLYQSPKIVVAKIGLRCEAIYDQHGEYASINTNCLHQFREDYLPEYVVCWLNSRLYNYVFECMFDGLRMSGGYLLYAAPNLRNTYIKKLPITKQEVFVPLSQSISKMYHDRFSADSKFREVLRVEYRLKSWPNKLSEWWTMEYPEFIGHLPTNLSLAQRRELLDFHGEQRVRVLDLSSQIRDLNSAINGLIYEYYDLSPEEVETVERAMSRLW